MATVPESIHPETEANAPEETEGSTTIRKRRSNRDIPNAGTAAIEQGIYAVTGCQKCPLHVGAQANLVNGYGPNPAKVLIVFNYASQLDGEKIPSLLRQAISAAKIPLTDIRYTSAIRCINSHVIYNPESVNKECYPHLLNEIAVVNPKVIITIGTQAHYAISGKKKNGNFNSIVAMEDGRYRINLYPELTGTLNSKLHRELFSSLKKVNNLLQDITYPPDAKYVIVKSEKQLEKAKELLLKCPELVFDFEVGTRLDKEYNGFDPEDKLLCCGFSWGTGRAIVIPLDHDDNTLDKAACHQVVKDVLRSQSKKIGHNVIYDQYAAYHFYNGLETANVAFDTMLAHHLLDPTQKTHSLKYLTGIYTPYGGYEEALDKYKTGTDGVGNYANVPLDILARYCCVDVDMTWRLYEKFAADIKANADLHRLHSKLVAPISNVFYAIRKEGMYVNKDKLLEIRDYYDEKLKRALAQLYSNPLVVKHAPNLNIASPLQLQNLLFDTLKLRVVKLTPASKPSTDEEAVNRLAALYKKDTDVQHLLSSIIEIRKCNKFIGTYIDGVLPHVQNNRIYTSYLLHGTTSARPSSINPNLLNIPSEDAKDTPPEYHIKQAFEAPKGYLFCSADYSQIELRNIGNETGEPELVDAYLQGVDMHRKTASLIFGVDLDQVVDYMRKLGKTTNFGGAYGAGPATLASQIEKKGSLSDSELLAALRAVGIYVSDDEGSMTADRRNKLMEDLARKIQTTLFSRWAVFSRWQRRQRDYAEKFAHVKSRFGRVRYLHFPPNATNKEKWKLINVAVNYPIQSVSSDCLMLAMVRIHAEFKKRGMKSHIVGQVYDSINYYIHESEKDEALSLIKTVMECEPLLYDREYFTIPMEVDIAVGPTWADLKKVSDIKYLEGVYE